MKTGVEIRVGHVLSINGSPCKVLTQEIRGSGKLGKTAHCKLKDLSSGNMLEKSFRSDEKIEELDLERVKMEYSYKDGELFVFMNMENYEQFLLPAATVGKQSVFLRENMEIDVEFVQGKPLSIAFPKSADLKVLSTPSATKGANDSNYKEASLENELKVLVPQFVKEGDLIKVDTNSFEYIERISNKN